MARVVIITGASAGIGRATADELSRRGWTVVGASRRGHSGDAWDGIQMDVDDDESVTSGIDRVLATHGRIDALVAAAGWGLAGPVETTALDEARAQVETNFWGVVRTTTTALPHLRASGTSSASRSRPITAPASSPSKAGPRPSPTRSAPSAFT
jgi:NAD(P)-dependent dehydrogenase (short-subunit alcohol dehydrogenase family)